MMVVLLVSSMFAVPGQASTILTQTLTNDNGHRPTWGLDILDQRSATLNDTYTYGYTGQGVKVYVLDTGVNSTHVEFGSRVPARVVLLQLRCVAEGVIDVVEAESERPTDIQEDAF